MTEPLALVHSMPLLPSQDALAKGFVAGHVDNLRYDHSADRWYQWSGNLWRPDKTKSTFAELREYIDKLVAPDNRSARTHSFVHGYEKLAQTDQRIAVVATDWNHDHFLLGTPQGTVDLRTGELRPADPDDLINKTVAVLPISTVDCPLWLAFLDEATGGDSNMIAFLKRLCGYALTGDTREQILAYVYGPGGNGKSVFINTIAGILNDYATTAAMETFTVSRFDRHPTELAMLHGARLVTASETEEERKWAASRIKQLTGGDPVTAHFMRQDNFTYRPQFKLVIVGNHAPQLGQVDDAIRRRFLIVPFTRKPREIDLKLEEKMRAEWPCILRWMIDGAVLWQAQGLNPPAAVTTATQEYFHQEDLIGQWLEECCSREPDLLLPVVDAFKSWKEFARERGADAGTERTFSPQMRHRGFKNAKRKYGDKRAAAVWVGLALNPS